MDWRLHSPQDYFAKKQSTDCWTKQCVSFDVTYWRRSLAEISREIEQAGFVINSIAEPMPDESLASVEPKTHDYLTTHPHFLFFRISPAAKHGS